MEHCAGNLFWVITPCQTKPVKALTNTHLRPLSYVCQSSWINSSPRWEWQSDVPDGFTCPFQNQKCLFFFFFASVGSDRGSSIFRACCVGCFHLTHPSGLVFKPWPSGSGMMRTLFQSRQARRSSVIHDGHNFLRPHYSFSSPLSQIHVGFFTANMTLVLYETSAACHIFKVHLCSEEY